jgi:hypothetical protein
MGHFLDRGAQPERPIAGRGDLQFDDREDPWSMARPTSAAPRFRWIVSAREHSPVRIIVGRQVPRSPMLDAETGRSIALRIEVDHQTRVFADGGQRRSEIDGGRGLSDATPFWFASASNAETRGSMLIRI